MQFAAPVDPRYQYFFLIRNANDGPVAQNGPVPVILPGGNGFATGASPGSPTPGFTDFVVFSQVRQVSNTPFTVYHVAGGISGDPNRNIFEARGSPALVHSPLDAGNDPTVIAFELDLSQIQPDPSDVDPNKDLPGDLPRWLQVNVVATNVTPIDPQSSALDKVVDAFGIGVGDFNHYLTIDASRSVTYQSNDPTGIPEQQGDTYGPGGPATLPAVDLLSWSITVKH